MRSRKLDSLALVRLLVLSPGKIYCDMNSISPETTTEMQQAISTSGADFVKIAIMAGIPDRGFEVPLLAGGSKAEEVSKILLDLGLTIRAIGSDPRQPAAIKILRSVCLKGIVALAYEMVRGAEKYGVVDQVLDSASEVLSRASFKKTVDNWLASTAIHARRRAKEMEEAIETLDDAGIHPVMSIGTKKVFEEIAGFELDKVFQGQIPDSFYRVLETIANRTSSKRID
jgi:3-hydroxyisobutyrate dehydrogenase-like beta-hydroxyacid dehydrogenase